MPWMKRRVLVLVALLVVDREGSFWFGERRAYLMFQVE